MIEAQIRCDGTAWRGTTGRWVNVSLPIMLLAMLVSLSACQKYVVIVDVPVKAKFTPPGNIKEFEVRPFEGPAECARDLEKGIHARAANAGDLVPRIIGLPDLDGPLEVRGKVDVCSMRMGYGVLNATMQLLHGGQHLYQEIVREETTKPGASSEEVRVTLVDRVIKKFVYIFVSGTKQEIRELPSPGGSDPVLEAMRQKNWKLAIELLKKRVDEDPKDHRSWYSLGVAHEGDGQLSSAVKDYKKAVELERDDLYVNILIRAEKVLQDSVTTAAAKKARE